MQDNEKILSEFFDCTLNDNNKKLVKFLAKYNLELLVDTDFPFVYDSDEKTISGQVKLILKEDKDE